MNDFSSLLARAKTKRDHAIARTRSEYNATLVAIAALEQDLTPDRAPGLGR